MAELAGVALAVPPTIDLCLKYGRELKALCSSLKHADIEIGERLVRLDQGWLRWSHQLNFLQRVEHTMDNDHREIYEQTLQIFLGKLKTVTTILQGLVQLNAGGDGYVGKPVKYALKKNSLDKAIEELEVWQRTADHSWFLLMKIASPVVDAAIVGDNASIAATIPSVVAIRAGAQNTEDSQDNGVADAPSPGISFGPEELVKMRISPVPFSDVQLGHRDDQDSSFILDNVFCPPFCKDQVKKNTRNLVRKLLHTEPETFGLLSCKGFVVEKIKAERMHEIKFTMIFKVPREFAMPVSFRDVLLNGPQPASLSTRFGIARDLARSVSYIHSFGFVHKAIRPESILDFADKLSGKHSLFLVGFENSRHEDGATHRGGDDVLSKNLYRHPSRQGVNPRDQYIMQHDIYSLGVCLLEVGLWQSFIEYTPDQDSRDAVSPVLSLPADKRSEVLSFLELNGKDHFVEMARTRLPAVMGSKYTEIVETCLTCLDPENSDFGDEHEFEDEDGIRVGVRYIEKVLLRLNMLYV